MLFRSIIPAAILSDSLVEQLVMSMTAKLMIEIRNHFLLLLLLVMIKSLLFI